MAAIKVPTLNLYKKIKKIENIFLACFIIFFAVGIISFFCIAPIINDKVKTLKRDVIEPIFETATVISNDVDTFKEFNGYDFIDAKYIFDENGKISEKKEFVKDNIYLVKVGDNYAFLELLDNTYKNGDIINVLSKENSYIKVSENEIEKLQTNFYETTKNIIFLENLSVITILIAFFCIAIGFIFYYMFANACSYTI